MIIGSHYRLRHLNGDLKVTVNSQQLTRVTNYRYLGTEVDEALGWQPFYRWYLHGIKTYSFPGASPNLLKMYDALVAPYFDYCSEVWGFMGDSRDCKIGLGEL